MQYSNELSSPSLTLEVWPSATPTSFDVYEDDGLSTDYLQGDYATTRVDAVTEHGNTRVTVATRELHHGGFRPPSRDLIVRLRGPGSFGVPPVRLHDQGQAIQVSLTRRH
jgi:alpha-glucosidase (family GH31 glycosyl hydrolase)